MRARLLILHRWLGLATAVFLVVAGLTGALLAFEEPLDRWLAPQLYRPLTQQGPLAAPQRLREIAEAQLAPRAQIDTLPLRIEAGRTVRLPVSPRTDPQGGQPFRLDYDEIYADPRSGEIVGRRDREALALRAENLMPLTFKLHHSLALPGVFGALLLGVVALAWTLDCFIGAALTLPRAPPRWRRWFAAWRIKLSAGGARATYDLHRAGGLWLWLALLLFAWSSVMFNLNAQVYRPLMALFFEFDDSWSAVPARGDPAQPPALDWSAAHAAGQRAMAELARQQGFVVDWEDSLRLNRVKRTYAYLVHSSADLRSDAGNTAVLIDADSGVPLGHWLPTGGKPGNTVSNWLGALHMAQVFGWPWRVFVFALGMATALLAITGVAIWWRKRRNGQRRWR